ncbi:MAG: hypothetical protein M1812_004183 [Candelaria pacifica]|nr:MAG: hypothetical protein M1812_004183 [Candelaria pacifica]
MTAVPLTSDHVNYLVWRYLQESGHGEAAVKLQRDWNRNPQSLPFAQYIKTHALVSLVQKGLQYHEIEQTIDQYGNRIQASSPMFFFGPDSGPLDLPDREDFGEDGFCQPRSIARKHGREAESHGLDSEQASQHLSKKTRRSKSHGAESIEANDQGDAMEIEQNGYSHAEPSPKADTPASPTPAAEAEVAQELQGLQEPEPTNTLTNGKSVGVQSDKVVELGPDSTLFLELAESHETSHEMKASLAANNGMNDITDATTNGRDDRIGRDAGGVGPEGGIVSVTHLAWNPKNPAILATAGDGLSRIWNLTALASTVGNSHMHVNGNGFSNTTGQTNGQINGQSIKTQDNHHVDLVPSSEPSLTTAWSWSPDGETLAVATRDLTADWDGEATTWSKDGRILHVLPAGHDMMLALQWNPLGSLLLGIATNGQGSTILLWDSSTGQLATEFTSSENLTDAVWLSEADFVCCGDRRMIRCRISTDSATPIISLLQDIKTEIKWLHLKCDVACEVIATIAEDDSVIGIAKGFADLSVHMAHDATITGFEFRPMLNGFTDESNPASCLVTTCTDGKVRLWKVDGAFELMQEFFMGPSVPAMAASFSPDGALIAAASYRRLLIWDAEKGNVPIASWNVGTEQWPTEEEVVEGGSSEEHLLKWQVDGGRLAYGLGHRVSGQKQKSEKMGLTR